MIKNEYKFIYLLSNDWLWDWESLVGYNDVIKDQEPSSKYFAKDSPGPVNEGITSAKSEEFRTFPSDIEE